MQTTSVRNDGGESTGITILEYVPLADGNLLHMLQPERATNFIFGWLDIVTHRELVDQTLGASKKDGVSHTLRAAYRAVYAQLLVDRLKFLSFYLHTESRRRSFGLLHASRRMTATHSLWRNRHVRGDLCTGQSASRTGDCVRITGFLLTFLIDNPGLYTSALAASTAATEATRGEHDGSEALSQEAPPPPHGKKAKKVAAAKAAAAAAQQQAVLSAGG
ncbi:unnamed protein product [Mesocestoides corti]|uniref:CCR4-Not complex component Not1 C-terminal domain-containing protein n=1 Tax=Mesocestoides corti TaxID=53468 RepID=A0A0R3URQ3_MESCO|nr:unnamed protein product [Mesocestoides corti]